MINFAQEISKQDSNSEIDPIQLYKQLDRDTTTGDLRQIQENILKEWFSTRRNDKDLIIKLHTGQGKTLIGLLILLSNLREFRKPVLYLCPNKYLVSQVCKEAEKFGIPYCGFSSEQSSFPTEFSNGEKILITTVQKLFNGKSIFGTKGNFFEVGSMVIDDSHACIDAIKSASIVTIERDNALYESIKNLFALDLKAQGEGSFLDLDNKNNDLYIPIPYWAWIEKHSDLLSILQPNVENISSLKFAWPIIRDCIQKCEAFISPRKIEISPKFNPIVNFKSYTSCEHRILMSATTQNDSFFIKNLNFALDAIKNPLSDSSKKYSGEKMVLIPNLISDCLSRDIIVNKIASQQSSTKIVSLVPSLKRADFYDKIGATVLRNDNDINIAIKELSKKDPTTCKVFVNRYDGIDLPDAMCRILILDSLPYYANLSERYEEESRTDSVMLNTKIAQKIEQGLGRSIRGEKDYSVILIIGSDLVEFIRKSKNKALFSPQTIAQIEIGFDIARMAKNENIKSSNDINDVIDAQFKELVSLISQSIKRDNGWKLYYAKRMDELISKWGNENSTIYTLLQAEKEAEDAFLNEEYSKSAKIISKIVDNTDGIEKAWYLQLLAYYTFFDSKESSNKIQLAAYKANRDLLMPTTGVEYNKIVINEKRTSKIRKILENKNSDFYLHLDALLSNLSFGILAKKFEQTLKEIGNLLGFESQRPDNENKVGPDNLWAISAETYIIFECKSEVALDRSGLSKSEVGQMLQHIKWFKSMYGNVRCSNIVIFPKNKLEKNAFVEDDEIRVMTESELAKLRDNIKNFFKEFKNYSALELTDDKITACLKLHNLNFENFTSDYSSKLIKKGRQE